MYWHIELSTLLEGVRGILLVLFLNVENRRFLVTFRKPRHVVGISQPLIGFLRVDGQ